jgi:REP element-mobilizing transposase RayT
VNPKTPKGWHSRGYLPHFDSTALVQGVTFRLHDAVPRRLIEHWKRELQWIDQRTDGDGERFEKQRRDMHRLLSTYEDAGHGTCCLREPAIARIVDGALRHFEGERYALLAWCIMPNHVHTLLRTHSGWRTGDIVHSWKGYTAQAINALRATRGTFWAPDYYDRSIRNEAHYWRAVRYIHANPVKAHLCTAPEQWLWSSAFAGNPET